MVVHAAKLSVARDVVRAAGLFLAIGVAACARAELEIDSKGTAAASAGNAAASPHDVGSAPSSSTSPLLQPAARRPLLEYKRSGGFAGTCHELEVFDDGLARWKDCHDGDRREAGTRDSAIEDELHRSAEELLTAVTGSSL